ncbi:serine/threonine-protein kinase [Streptomyces sp. RTGN2]|uniref:serine/threonine-protein kinase n=1 Tax=Streptomyces sp. RTGN2 TaxID=3016525 RepID=UPI00255442AC|nr:serine/threonine-protein kinase [Streptomyces sp. RTGN2]
MRLGHGGVGEVWKGQDLELDRAVALKVLREFDAAEQVLQRFRREARIGAQLKHPGITVVHDVGHHENQLFIVMELLEGADLAALLSQSSDGLPVPEAVGLALQVAEALSAAHEQQVVHRDLKPGNLFLLTDGRLKICDFGIARTAEATEGLTVTGRAFGTPPYMAPEQWRGEHVDARCDLYALGCVLFALLTGAPPFPATDQPWALMLRHVEEVPPPLRSVREDVPVDLESLVTALLAKKAAARPDARTVVQRLRVMPRASQPGVGGLGQATVPPSSAAPERDAGSHTLSASRGVSRRTVTLGGVAALVAVSGATIAALRLGDDSNGDAGSKGHGRSVSPSSSKSPHQRKGPPVWGPVATLRARIVHSVAFSPDGKSLATSDNGSTRLWNITTRKDTTFSTEDGFAHGSVAFTPDGRTLVVGQDGAIQLWDTATRECTFTFTEHADGVDVVALSPDGRTLASGNGEVIRLWDITKRTHIATLNRPKFFSNAMAFSPNGKTLAAGGDDATISLWNIATRRLTATLKQSSPYDYIRALAFSPDGATIAGGGIGDDSDSPTGDIRLWDTATRTRIATLRGNTDILECVAFSPDGKTIAGGSDDTHVRLWDVPSRSPITTLTGHTGTVNSVAFSPDGKTIASGSDDTTVRLWGLS